MKKLFYVVIISFVSLSVKSQSFNIGLYFNSSHQHISYIGDALIFKPQKYRMLGWEFGLSFRFNINNDISLKAMIGNSQNHVDFYQSFLPLFQYNDIPLAVAIRTNLISFNRIKVYLENGVSVAYCHSYSYNRIIGPSKDGFIIGGTISDYNFKKDISYGFVNGIGISYTLNSGVVFELYADYYSGINTIWENSEIEVLSESQTKKYTFTSNGSSLNIGCGIGYNF